MLTAPGEHVWFESRRHGIVLARAFARSFTLLAVGMVLLTLGWPVSVAGAVLALHARAQAALDPESDAYRELRRRLVAVQNEVLLTTPIYTLADYDPARRRATVVVTSEKLFVAHGILRRRAAAVRLTRVGAIEVEQTLPGRLLGYGTIVAGELEIDYVPAPRRIYGLVDQLGGAGS